MDKTELKKILKSLEKNTEITINFMGTKKQDSGKYLVAGIKKGRGKGGSTLVDLKSLDGSKQITVGTPHSTEILQVIVDGTLYGYEKETDVPKVYPTDSNRQIILKEEFKKLLTLENVPVTVESSEPEFNGSFTLKEVKKSAGRYGQIIMTLIDSNGVEKYLSSYKHSGIITRVIINSQS